MNANNTLSVLQCLGAHALKIRTATIVCAMFAGVIGIEMHFAPPEAGDIVKVAHQLRVPCIESKFGAPMCLWSTANKGV